MSDCYTPTDGEVLEAWAVHNTPDLPTALDLVAAYDAFKRWLAEHDAALIEGLADEVHATLSDPNRKRPRDPQGEFATDLLNDVAWAVHLIREKARQRREEKP